MEDLRCLLILLLPIICWSGCVQDVCNNYVCMYRLISKDGKLNTDPIDGLKCTHVHLCYLTYSETGIVLPNSTLFNDIFAQCIKQLKERSPKLKILMSYQVFDKMLNVLVSERTKKHLKKFIQDTARFARNNSFDGLSFRFHSLVQSSQRARDTLTSVLKKMRIYLAEEALKKSLPRLMLVLIASASVHLVDHLYKVNVIHRFVDYTILAGMDFEGSKNSTAPFHNAPLYGSENTADISVNSGVISWLSKNHPGKKLFLGVPFYGVYFSLPHRNNLRIENQESLHSNHVIIPFKEVCTILYSQNVTYVYDVNGQVPYILTNDFWLGFENEDSIAKKVTLVVKYHLAGVAVFYVNDDDMSGNTCRDGPFPLMRSLYLTCLNMNLFDPIS